RLERELHHAGPGAKHRSRRAPPRRALRPPPRPPMARPHRRRPRPRTPPGLRGPRRRPLRGARSGRAGGGERASVVRDLQGGERATPRRGGLACSTVAFIGGEMMVRGNWLALLVLIAAAGCG